MLQAQQQEDPQAPCCSTGLGVGLRLICSIAVPLSYVCACSVPAQQPNTQVPVCLLACCSDQAIRLVRKVHPHTASVLRSLSTSASTSSLA
jgi:hypothetical protein